MAIVIYDRSSYETRYFLFVIPVSQDMVAELQDQRTDSSSYGTTESRAPDSTLREAMVRLDKKKAMYARLMVKND